MTCEEFAKNIDTYLDGDLDKNSASDFMRHLKSCQRCRMEKMSFEKCKQLLRKFSDEVNPPAAIRKKVFEKLGCCDVDTSSCCSAKQGDKAAD
ncbi:MAG: anti-sigma factor family protein [bacterium]